MSVKFEKNYFFKNVNLQVTLLDGHWRRVIVYEIINYDKSLYS